MAAFARIEDGIVRQVVVVLNEALGDTTFPESEPLGQQFLADSGLPGNWVQTSASGSYRGKFGGIGDLWDGENFTSPPPPADSSTV